MGAIESLGLSTDQLWTNLQSLLGMDMERIEKESQFVERRSARLRGMDFLRLHLCHFSTNPNLSLNEMGAILYENSGISLIKLNKHLTNGLTPMRFVY